MSDQQDIIGLVKELRQLAKNATEGDWRIETNSHGLKQDIIGSQELNRVYRAWPKKRNVFVRLFCSHDFTRHEPRHVGGLRVYPCHKCGHECVKATFEREPISFLAFP